MTVARVALLVPLWLAACGVQPVELLPLSTAPVGSDEFVVGELPPEALARLRSQRTEQGAEQLQLIEPAPRELVVPANLAPILFEWRSEPKKPGMMNMAMAMMPADPQPPAAGRAAPAAEPMPGPKADKAKGPKVEEERPIAFELRAHSELADVRVYTAADAASFPPERWSRLLREHSAGRLRIELRGVYQDSRIVHAPALELNVRPALPAGLFYGFSSTGQGLTVAELSDTHEHRLQVPALREGGCVGCHAISRDGKHMLASVAGATQLLRWSPPSDDTVVLAWPDATAGLRYIQASFDATAARIAAAAGGQLLIFNADTGALLQHTGSPLMASVSAPDWSPDNRSIVVESGRAPEGLARIDVGLDGSLSALTPLVEASGDERLRAPVYSPDGEWVAYERHKGPVNEAKDVKLFLVSARGGEPIELHALAHGTKSALAPSFAPAGEPGHVYLLFSAQRAVGSFTPQEGQRQLFAAELDLSLAAAGEDPSHEPFWLPFQQRSNSYLSVKWAPAAATCTQTPEVCDGVDDDCDQKVDEDCCAPTTETCGDNHDDDCDGRVDEGCSCVFQEVCGNQTDDDCDLSIDEKPCGPAAGMP